MIPADTPIGKEVRVIASGQIGAITEINPSGSVCIRSNKDNIVWQYYLKDLELVNTDTMQEYLEERIKDVVGAIDLANLRIDELTTQLDEKERYKDMLATKRDTFLECLAEYKKQFKEPT